MGETSKAKTATLPDCMMPDGADPCIAYQQMADRLAEAEAWLEKAADALRDHERDALADKIDEFLSGGSNP